MKNFIILLFLTSLVSCSDQELQQNFETTKLELESQKKENARLLTQMNKLEAGQVAGQLIHYVFLDLKNDLSQKQIDFVIGEVKKLEKITVVEDLQVGVYEEMNDDRALSGRELNFEMRFKSKADYYSYQKHADHIKLRQTLSPFLDKAPLTYDYLIR